MMSTNQKNQKNRLQKNFDQKLLIKDHFIELINRFYYWLFFFVAGCIVGYYNHAKLLNWIIAPLNKPLFYTSPIGGFEVVFQVSTIFGFVISFPFLLYNLLKFIDPVRGKFTGKAIWIYILCSLVLAFIGISVSYYLIFPASLEILGKFGASQLEPLISTKDYFNFAYRYLLGFVLLFQLPLVIYLINLFVQLSPGILFSKLKYVVVGSFLIAAILTPTPDLINQTIMAAPIIILYIITILILLLKKYIVN